jgi:hypothetical protein
MQNGQIITVMTMNYLKTGIEPIIHNSILGLCMNSAPRLSKHHHHYLYLQFCNSYHPIRYLLFSGPPNPDGVRMG